MADEHSMAPPRELRVSKDRRLLTVAFGETERYAIEAELLRVCSPSAEVQGHGPGQKVTVYGKRNVEIMKIDPVGNYAVRITFDDMHNTGIYSWTFLRDLGSKREERWADYEAELAEKQLSREPMAPRR